MDSEHGYENTLAAFDVSMKSWDPGGPLGQGWLLTNPTVTAVAEDCGRTPAQVLIRWHIQLSNIVIPKSVNPERIASNFDVFDLELSENDMASISSLDDGTGWVLIHEPSTSQAGE